MAPDYLYIHRDVQNEFLSLLEKAIKELYTEDVFESGEFTRIVSEKHFKRLTVYHLSSPIPSIWRSWGKWGMELIMEREALNTFSHEKEHSKTNNSYVDLAVSISKS